MENPNSDNDAIGILPAKKIGNHHSILFCPQEKPTTLSHSEFHDGHYLCPRAINGQDIIVNYFDYQPFFYMTDNPEQPEGMIIDAFRILAEKKHAKVSFLLSSAFSAFNPETGTWHIGCVSIVILCTVRNSLASIFLFPRFLMATAQSRPCPCTQLSQLGLRLALLFSD